MIKDNKLEEKIQGKKKVSKRDWESPTIQDLSINSGTLNRATKGTIGPDGGPAFADYNS